MSLRDRHSSITVRGLVCPSDWDDEDHVLKVSIYTFDDDVYEVEPEHAGAYLVEHCGEEVSVRGRLIDGFRRRKIIQVKSFSVLAATATEDRDTPIALVDRGAPIPRIAE